MQMTDLVQTVLENLLELPGDHPALKEGRLRKKAVRVLTRKPLPSRVAAYPSLYDARRDLDTRNPVRNTELFNRIADAIEWFPEAYDQTSWGQLTDDSPCGTAFCIAGHAGHEIGWKRSTALEDHEDGYSVQNPYNPDETAVVSELARLELGLTETESVFLFAGAWHPANELTVPEALRGIGHGLNILEVSRESSYTASLEDEYNEPDRVIRTTATQET